MESRSKKVKINVQFEVEYDEVQYENNWVPKTLYKYRNWHDEKHQSIIKENSIWIPDAADFNDPFDCNIPMDYSSISGGKKMMERLYKIIVTPEKNGKVPNLYDEAVQRQLFENRFSNPDFISDFRKAVVKEHKRRNGIFSLTPINNNILVWSHYANSHKGFCVGFDTVKLFKSLSFTGAYVAYQSKYPIVSPFEESDSQWQKMVFTKSNHWEYELEYRLILAKVTNQLIEINPDVYSEIIFGERMLEADKNEIRKVLVEKYPNIKIYNCVQNPSNFELQIIKEN
jgi:hypothetical protein